MMKKFSLLLLVLAGTLSLTSCKKDDFTADAVTGAVTAGTWKITHYSSDGTDETAQFNGYSFTFNTDGTGICIHGADTTAGTWSTLDSDDDDHTHFILNFGAVSPFDEIADDWHVIGQSDTSLELEDVSGGSGGTDLLTFTKE